jgi:ABC-type transport system involved in multi-copper enzyme maturation permease subunit
MMRLTWRQLRLPALSTGTLLGLLAVFLLLTERTVTAYMRTSGLNACLAAHSDCSLQLDVFRDKYESLLNLVGWLNFAPMVAGLFWGAPLIARELEQGTYRLAWTQSVTRRRWLAVKFGTLVVGAVVFATVLTALFAWWLQPFNRAGLAQFSRISPSAYNFSGIVPAAYTLFAFALGTAAGAVLRRTLPAMAVTLGGFLALRLGIQALRGHFLAPLVAVTPFGGARGESFTGNNWVLSTDLVDRQGNVLGQGQLPVLCPPTGRSVPTQCLVEHGLQLRQVYQPASRFWPLQGIETGIFAAVSIALLGLAAWWTLRRIR